MSDSRDRFTSTFTAHGFEPTRQTDDEVIGTCPLTGKREKFYVNPVKEVWHSKTAGLGGTRATFLDLIQETYIAGLTKARLQTLADDRGLPIQAFRPWNFGWDGRSYTIAVRDVLGITQDIRRYRLKSGERRMLSTPGCKVGLLGAHFLGQHPMEPVHLVEGESDLVAMAWLLKTLGESGIVVAVPGAGIFKSEWSGWLRGRTIHTYYDNDDAGRRGELLIAKHRLSDTRLTFTHWPSAAPIRYDVRDHVHKVAIRLKKPKACLRRLRSYAKPETRLPFEPKHVDSNLVALAPDEAMALMNARYAVVGTGGSTAVVDLGDIDTEIYWRFEEFKKFHANRVVQDGAGLIPLGKYWLNIRATDRRQFERAICAPPPLVATENELNLWSGFAIPARKGSWTQNQEHLRQIICSGNEQNFAYLLNYLKALCQKPGLLPEVAIAMKGPQGAGKGFFVVQTIAPFFSRRHFLQLSQSRHLTGNFNAHLAGRIVVFADEAFFAGDRQQVGALKALVTEPRLTIERKGIDVTSEPNLVHLFIASNEHWIVPADFDERRFLMLNVSGAHAQDTVYFARLKAELDGGGRAAMLHDLQRGKVDLDLLRHPPVTTALIEQKLLSMQPHERWWHQKLVQGRLLESDQTWTCEAEKVQLYEDYLTTLRNLGSLRRSTLSELGTLLQRLVPSGYPTTRRPWARINRKRHWVFPPLEICRDYFDGLTRTKHKWPFSENGT